MKGGPQPFPTHEILTSTPVPAVLNALTGPLENPREPEHSPPMSSGLNQRIKNVMSCCASLALLACLSLAAAGSEGDPGLSQSYAAQIHPLLVKTCGKCHGETPKDNDLDIAGLNTADALFSKPAVLSDIAGRLTDGDMPPRKAPQPSAAEKEQLLNWIQSALDFTASAKAGDPGPVTLRRLSNNAYDNAVRDLTGVDMRPTRAGSFPPDSVGGEGFANVGEAMPMNPGLVERYHEAARYVAARAVLLPTGFRFSPSADRPVWTSEAEKALRTFHSRYADNWGRPPRRALLMATIKHRQRLAEGGVEAIAAVADEEKLNAPYLAKLWEGLSGASPSHFLDAVRKQWRETTDDPSALLKTIDETMEKLFASRYLKYKHSVLAVGNGFPAWEDALRVVSIEHLESAAREPVFRLVARQVAPAVPGTFVVWDRMRLEGGDAPSLLLASHPELRSAIEAASGLRFGQHPQGRPVPPTALVTEAGSEVRIELKKLPEPLQKLLALPRLIRADVSLDTASPETASVQAFILAEKDFRDPKDPAKLDSKRTNPTAWRSGDPLITDEPELRVAQIVHPRVAAERARPAAEFRALFPPSVLFEPIIPRDAQGSLFMFHREDEPLQRLMLDDAGRAELDRLWSELHFISEDAHAHALMYAELVKFYANANGAPQMDFFFNPLIGERVKRDEASLSAALGSSEPLHLDALLAFAERAWRRPLGLDERSAILAEYRSDRAAGTKHDPALRAALARVLSSPWFLYRVEQPATGPRWQPVPGFELATRLSFLLWDSMPDDALRTTASRLREPGVLEAQLQRMLKDERVRGMAEEFGARWLGVRDFVANHGRSLKDFPTFTPAVRDLLAEEPVRFFEDSLRNDRPVDQLLTTDATVLNDALASFYGIPGITGNSWRRVEKLSAHGRGGVLGLGAVLAKQSAAARTSPIKRGAWLAQILGDRLPKPPASVPPLPETPPEGLTVRELTARHREDASCASCHDRIDPYGLAFEQFDAIGRLRPVNQMQPGESRSTLRDGTTVNGFAEIRNYVVDSRRKDFLKTLARKLTGYALSRAVLPSDKALVDELSKTLIDGGRWSDALLVLVRSEQFQCIRPTAATASNSP